MNERLIQTKGTFELPSFESLTIHNEEFKALTRFSTIVLVDALKSSFLVSSLLSKAFTPTIKHFFPCVTCLCSCIGRQDEGPTN